MNCEILLTNLNRLHTTPMGVARIKRNLNLNTDQVVEFCRTRIATPQCQISRQGKNWYCAIGNIMITVNATSYTIITAHRSR